MHAPFKDPITVTRPMLPDLDLVQDHLKDIWQAKWLTNQGPKHQQLEKMLREYLKVTALSLFNNGTVALLVASEALGLTGEVITTPFTFPATVHCLTWNGLTPVFCDIDPITMTIDPKKIEALITPRTTAILGVHVYGTPCAVKEIEAIAKRHNLKVIYDAAHAFGVEIAGKPIGAFGDMTMFSFHATKLFHTVEGGCLTVNDPALKKQIDLLKNFGIENEETVSLVGINGKLNEVQAAIGLINMDLMGEERANRQAVENIYRKRLKGIDGLTLVERDSATTPSLQYFVIRINEKRFGMSRNALHAKLKEYNVLTRKYFHPLCSNYACYNHLPSAQPSNLVESNLAAEEVLALPFYGALALEDVEKICDLIREQIR